MNRSFTQPLMNDTLDQCICTAVNLMGKKGQRIRKRRVNPGDKTD